MPHGDRLFTAFVSSTFRDLESERTRVSRVLLDHSCLPMGMEYFPSDGREVWSLIETSMQKADFFVLIVGTTYGSVDQTTQQSWTQREYHRMLELEKPIVALLCTQFDRELDSRLLAFREEIESEGLGCQYWSNEADLVERLALSIRSLVEQDDRALGWTRALPPGRRGRSPRWENLFYRTSWRFEPSSQPDRWDAVVVHHRRLRVVDVDGIASIRLNHSRPDTGHVLPFTAADGPRTTLVQSERSSGAGRVYLGERVRLEPSRYRRELILDPRSLPHEEIEFEVRTHFPAGRLAYSDDLRVATAQSTQRDYDYQSMKVAEPTDLLEIVVAFGSELLADVRGVEAVRLNDEIDHLETRRARDELTIERDASGETVARLRLAHPRMSMRYRVSWVPPARPS